MEEKWRQDFGCRPGIASGAQQDPPGRLIGPGKDKDQFHRPPAICEPGKQCPHMVGTMDEGQDAFGCEGPCGGPDPECDRNFGNEAGAPGGGGQAQIPGIFDERRIGEHLVEPACEFPR